MNRKHNNCAARKPLIFKTANSRTETAKHQTTKETLDKNSLTTQMACVKIVRLHTHEEKQTR